jgi:hypothetical protein
MTAISPVRLLSRRSGDRAIPSWRALGGVLDFEPGVGQCAAYCVGGGVAAGAAKLVPEVMSRGAPGRRRPAIRLNSPRAPIRWGPSVATGCSRRYPGSTPRAVTAAVRPEITDGQRLGSLGSPMTLVIASGARGEERLSVLVLLRP